MKKKYGLKVALIATIFNEEFGIVAFMDSIFNQTMMPDEIVLVDGGSTDNTFDIVKSYSEIAMKLGVQYSVIQKKCNIPTGRNIAIEQTKSEIVCVTDAGCFLESSWLEQIIIPLLDNENIDVVIGNFTVGGEEFLQKAFKIVSYKNKKTNCPSSRSFAFRKKCWRTFHYPEHLMVHEDTQLCNKWLSLGFNFVFQESAMVTWESEKSLTAIFKKYSRYSKWWNISGDKLDKMRKLQILTYVCSIVFIPISPLFSCEIIFLSIIIRLTRQYIRSKVKFFDIKYLPCAFFIQIILDIAVIYGNVSGFIFRKLRL